MPGGYTVRLWVDGAAVTQPLTVRMDPRVKTAFLDLNNQFTYSLRCYEVMLDARAALEDLRKKRARLKALKPTDDQQKDEIAVLDREAAALEGTGRRRGRRTEIPPPSLASLAGDAENVFGILQGADVAPTSQAVAACEQMQKSGKELLERFVAWSAKAKAIIEKKQ
jgi:hypothetical protein